MTTSIVFGRNVVEWVERELGHQFKGEALGLGLKRDGEFVMGVVYHDRQTHNVHVSLVSRPGGITRRFLKAFAYYAFVQLKVNRITACVRVSNNKSASIASRVGFVLEGVQRKGYPDGEDKLIFGMLREECKWLS